MKQTYQQNISQPTRELTEQVLKDLTQEPANNIAIECYRKMKRDMADA